MLLSSILVPVGFGTSFFARRIEHLYSTIDLISGIGLSMLYVSSTILVGRIFTGKLRAVCLSIYMASVSLSGLIYPYLIEWLLKQYGLYWSFLILGGLYCNKVPLLIICWIKRKSIDNQVSGSNGVQNVVTVETPNISFKKRFGKFRRTVSLTYVFVLLGVVLTVSNINSFFGFILDISEWKGISSNSSQGLLIFVLFNSAGTLARIMPGLLEQISSKNSFICPIISTILGVVGLMILYTSSSYFMFALSICMCGVAIGVALSSQHIILLEIVSKDQLPFASGLMFTSIGVITLSMGPIYGSIRDYSGSYGSVVITSCVILATAAVFLILACLRRRTIVVNSRKNEIVTIRVYSIS